MDHPARRAAASRVIDEALEQRQHDGHVAAIEREKSARRGAVLDEHGLERAPRLGSHELAGESNRELDLRVDRSPKTQIREGRVFVRRVSDLPRELERAFVDVQRIAAAERRADQQLAGQCEECELAGVALRRTRKLLQQAARTLEQRGRVAGCEAQGRLMPGRGVLLDGTRREPRLLEVKRDLAWRIHLRALEVIRDRHVPALLPRR
jgi:hypothetical protein